VKATARKITAPRPDLARPPEQDDIRSVVEGNAMPTTTWSTLNKVGLVLQFLYGLANLPSAFIPPEAMTNETGAETMGPPTWVLWADTVLSVVLIVAAIAAWRSANKAHALVASTSNVLISLSGVPAYFVGAPHNIQVLVTIGIVWTVVSVALTHLRAKA